MTILQRNDVDQVRGLGSAKISITFCYFYSVQDLHFAFRKKISNVSYKGGRP